MTCRIHRRLTCWLIFVFCFVCDRFTEVALLTCPSQCNAFPLIMCLSESSLLPVWGVTTSIRTFTHPPCNSWPCWCLPDLKALTVDNLSENSLPDKSSQFSDIPNMLNWNPTQSENVCRQNNKPETKSVSASESKTVFHWVRFLFRHHIG